MSSPKIRLYVDVFNVEMLIFLRVVVSFVDSFSYESIKESR